MQSDTDPDVTPQEYFDAQMRFSAILPDFEECLTAMARRSSGVAPVLGLTRLSSGTDPRQWVEIAKGTGAGRLLPVMIHGGYWRALRAEDHRFVLPGLAHLGRTIANLEYRLMPGTRMAGLVDDVRAGLAALASHRPDARILLVGHSAGAHLALAAARAAEHLPLAGVVAVSGVYDLAPVTHSFVQDAIALSADEVAEFTLPPQRDAVPVLYVTGTDETAEFQRQSAMMAAGGKAPWHRVPGAHHMNVLDSLADPTRDGQLANRIAAFCG